MTGRALLMGLAAAAGAVAACALLGAFFAAAAGDAARGWDWFNLVVVTSGISCGCVGILVADQ